MRYSVVAENHGFQVFDDRNKELCFLTWSLHRETVARWAQVLNEAYTAFRERSRFAVKLLSQYA